MLEKITLDNSYEAACDGFGWELPEKYNVAVDLLRRHDDAETRTALRYVDANGDLMTYTFGDLDEQSSRIANAFVERGIEAGDRVGVVMSQRPETLITHLACWKLGALTVPLSVLYGDDALRHRLGDCSARAVIADDSVLERVASVVTDLPNLEFVVGVGDTPSGGELFADLLHGASTSHEPAETTPESPAIIIYTSGTTGPAKGVLHTHAIWPSYCPAFCMYFEDLQGPQGIFWTPSDWAWIGGLGTVVFPAWHYGQSVVGAASSGFSPTAAFELMERTKVTHASFPPTALKRLSEVETPMDRYDLDLEVIVSGSEPLPPDLVEWVERTFEGVAINEGYGQTETGNIVTNCRQWFDLRPGSMGKPVPGYDVQVVDPETGDQCSDGDVGEIVVRTDAPGVYTSYWSSNMERAITRDEIAEAASALNEIDQELWHRTGDLARRDAEGYLWFVARRDDVITTSGYRVAPGDIESVLRLHEAVNSAGVIGIPDKERGERIAAFIVPTEGVSPNDDLRQELRSLVRDRFAKYAYPRSIVFVEGLPTTRTGKLDRSALSRYATDDER